MLFTLLSVLAALAPPSAWAAGAAGAAVGLMAETSRQKNNEVVSTSRRGRQKKTLTKMMQNN